MPVQGRLAHTSFRLGDGTRRPVSVSGLVLRAPRLADAAALLREGGGAAGRRPGHDPRHDRAVAARLGRPRRPARRGAGCGGGPGRAGGGDRAGPLRPAARLRPRRPARPGGAHPADRGDPGGGALPRHRQLGEPQPRPRRAVADRSRARSATGCPPMRGAAWRSCAKPGWRRGWPA
jgi:hypothetical protein